MRPSRPDLPVPRAPQTTRSFGFLGELSGYSFHDSRPEKVIALERAESVKRRLVECGFAPELIKTVGIAGPPAFYRDGQTGEYHDHDPRELRIVEIEVRYEEIVCVD